MTTRSVRSSRLRARSRASADAGRRAPLRRCGLRSSPARPPRLVKLPEPSTAKEPERTSSPGAGATGRDSPVRIDSSSLRTSLVSSVPSATSWSPGASRTRSPTTSSSTWTRRSLPSRTTVGRRRDERGEPVESALRPHLLDDPDRRVRDEDAKEERIAPVAEHERDDAEDEQDEVEDREDIGANDARVGAARSRRLDRAALGEPLRCLLRRQPVGAGRASECSTAVIAVTDLRRRPGTSPGSRANRPRQPGQQNQ